MINYESPINRFIRAKIEYQSAIANATWRGDYLNTVVQITSAKDKGGTVDLMVAHMIIPIDRGIAIEIIKGLSVIFGL